MTWIDSTTQLLFDGNSDPCNATRCRRAATRARSEKGGEGDGASAVRTGGRT